MAEFLVCGFGGFAASAVFAGAFGGGGSAACGRASPGLFGRVDRHDFRRWGLRGRGCCDAGRGIYCDGRFGEGEEFEGEIAEPDDVEVGGGAADGVDAVSCGEALAVVEHGGGRLAWGGRWHEVTCLKLSGPL